MFRSTGRKDDLLFCQFSGSLLLFLGMVAWLLSTLP